MLLQEAESESQKADMSGAKEKYGLPSGVWMLVGGLLALMSKLSRL
jgi:hypothetical protein